MQEANFQLHPGHHVGLTGANGTGKSSLFALMRGELLPDTGECAIPQAWVIAHVAQETPALDSSALAYTLDCDAELRQIQQHLAQAEAEPQYALPEQVAEWHQRLGDIDGYSAESRAATLLAGLGFSTTDLNRPVKDFSGGWRMRLNLARALMCRSDLLLLDEPTNHLDIEAVIWLEAWLKAYRGTLVLISHDRAFLDNTVNHILHLERQTLTLYRGGYSDFERQRAEQLSLQQAQFEKQQQRIAHLHKYIDRFRAQATKARQAQSRIKALERMEIINAAHIDSPFSFSFFDTGHAPDPLLVLQDAQLGYVDKPLIRFKHWAIRPGERVGLLGKNGAGKSTLMKAMADSATLLQGERIVGKDLNIGYFAQHQLEQLRADESPLQHLLRIDPQTREQVFLDYLGGFDFRGEVAKSPCADFSGGEKSRLALALLIWMRPNLILLDEPTNHLDLEMRHALALALQNYEGGMVIVSHDRTLLSACCDRFVIVDQGEVLPFDGDLDDYASYLREREATITAQMNANHTPAPKTNSYQQQKQDRQTRIAQRRPLLKQVAQLETRMQELQSTKSDLDARLQSPDLYETSEKEALQKLLKQHAETQQQLETTEMQWLEIQTELEALPEL